jgi:hypothetical protein
MTSDSSRPIDDSAQIYIKLRTQLLTLDPQQVEIKPTPEHPNAWACLMEFILTKSVVTLAAIIDGTASLYFSTGGGILGSGNHNTVGDAARGMVSEAEAILKYTELTHEFPLPVEGHIRFYILTHAGVFTTESPETALSIRKHRLSKFFMAGQYLITQIKLVSEKKANA